MGGRLTAALLERVGRLWRDGVSLRELRLFAEVTQVDLAERQGTTQGEVSRTERREDHLVSTVRRQVEALGGELDLYVRIGRQRVKLNL